MSKLNQYTEELHQLYQELKTAETEERKLILNRRINFLSFTILKIEKQERETRKTKTKSS